MEQPTKVNEFRCMLLQLLSQDPEAQGDVENATRVARVLGGMLHAHVTWLEAWVFWGWYSEDMGATFLILPEDDIELERQCRGALDRLP